MNTYSFIPVTNKNTTVSVPVNKFEAVVSVANNISTEYYVYVGATEWQVSENDYLLISELLDAKAN